MTDLKARALTEAELEVVCGGYSGTEINMMNLQSSMSKRSTMLQMTTNIMNSNDPSLNAIASKIKG